MDIFFTATMWKHDIALVKLQTEGPGECGAGAADPGGDPPKPRDRQRDGRGTDRSASSRDGDAPRKVRI